MRISQLGTEDYQVQAETKVHPETLTPNPNPESFLLSGVTKDRQWEKLVPGMDSKDVHCL